MEILHEKVRHDIEDKFWSLDTKLKRHQSEIEVPSFYLDSGVTRPVIAPFDPRFTLALYYSHINRNPDTLDGRQVPFHWPDWVDMTPLNPYLFAANKDAVSCSQFDERPYQNREWPDLDDILETGALDPAEYCRKETSEETHGLGFVIDKYFGRGREHVSNLLGKAYLYTLAPNPVSLTFLTKDGSYTVGVAREKSKLLMNSMVEEHLAASYKPKTINTLDEFQKLQKTHPPASDEVVHAYEVHLKHEDFVYNATKVLSDIAASRPSGSSEDQVHSYENSVKYSLAEWDTAPKYFYEARIFANPLGDHYDWRFFSGFKVGTVDHTNTLHRLVRSWLSFTRKQGILTWMAHGSLLSWYWNGVAFPWDNDIDVQVPVMSLHKLSVKFNQLLIIEDSEDGFGRYFLDCSSFIATRHHSNGNNNIDARFIDIDTGLYVDITALAVSQDESPDRYADEIPDGSKHDRPNYEINDQLQVYNCRNFHFASLTELSPLVKTFAEGEVAYVPKHYSALLTHEYEGGGLLQKHFEGRLFIPQLRLWVDQDILRFFMRHRHEWVVYYTTPANNHTTIEVPKTKGNLNNKEINLLLGLSESDLLDLLLADDLLMDYLLSRELTAVHEAEIMRLLFGKTTEDIVGNAPDFYPLRYEPFLYHLNTDYTTYEARVAAFQKLHDMMKDQIAKQRAESKAKTEHEPGANGQTGQSNGKQ